MPCQLTIRPKAIKVLEKLKEPDYSAIKKAIYNLAKDPPPTTRLQKIKRQKRLADTVWQLSYYL